MNLIIIGCVIFTIVNILAFFPLYAEYKDKDIMENYIQEQETKK